MYSAHLVYSQVRKVKKILSSVQSCRFVQCWPGIILVQCRGSLCNVVTTFGATGYNQKINRSKIKIAEKDVAQKTIHLPFSCRIFYGVPGYYTGHLAVKYCPSSIKTTLNSSFFQCYVVSSHLDNIVQGFCLPVQCCPKSIKTKLNKNFSCATLSRASWTTLDKDFTCAMLSQEY